MSRKKPNLLGTILAVFAGCHPEAASAETIISVTHTSYDSNLREQCTAIRMDIAQSGAQADACVPQINGSNGPDRVTRKFYDAAGRVLQVRKAVGTSIEIADATYTYTTTGKRDHIIDANGNRAEMRYDGHDRLVRWVFPSTTRPTAYNGATQATALGTAGSLNEGDYEAYGYDANGNRTSLRKRDGTTLTYDYDGLGRMIRKLVPERSGLAATNTRDVYYGYDLAGLQTFARFDSTSGEGVANSYDAFGRQTSMSSNMDGQSRQLSFVHDVSGNRTKTTWPDAAYVTMTFDGLDRMSQIRDANSVVLDARTYNSLGLLSNEARAGTAFDQSVSYDGIGRMSGLSITDGNASAQTSWGYTRNAASQILSETRSNDAFAYTGRYNVSRNYTTNGLNQYTAAGPASFCHDANGNLTADGSSVYLYDVENRLVEKRAQTNTTCSSLSYAGPLRASLRYDPLGRLYEVVGTATTRFLHDGDALVGEYDAAGSLLRRYVHGNDVGADDPRVWFEGSAALAANARHLYTDPRGSVVLAGDASGNALAIGSYDEYGIPGWSGSAYAPRFQYTGQAWLGEVGMYHYKARIYSPTLGRFLQTDPIGYEDQNNLYAYVGNDPVNGVDPSGEKVELTYHMVVSPYVDSARHFSIRITPDDQKSVANNPQYRNVDENGKHYTTLSGFPTQTVSFDHIGTLTKEQNRSTDVGVQEGSLTVATPKGMNEGDFIGNLQSSFNNYKDNLNYDLNPKKGTDGYNSNSFATGLIQSAGGTAPSLPTSQMGTLYAPGYDKPVPQTCFGRDNLC